MYRVNRGSACPQLSIRIGKSPRHFASATPHGAIHSPRIRSRNVVVRSSTATLRPREDMARAKAAPANPPPTITTSKLDSDMVLSTEPAKQAALRLLDCRLLAHRIVRRVQILCRRADRRSVVQGRS